MARPIWSGALSFGLVNVPVRLFTAVRHKEVRFHMMHDADGARIQLRRVCSAEGEEVPYAHIVKGLEIARGRYVVITPEELAALDPARSRTIDIQDFVALGDIDPIHYESTYHVLPDEGSERPYALLRTAMERQKRVAIAKFVMRTREYLCAVRPFDSTLVLSTMSYADEIVDAGELGTPARAKPNERELALAEQLIQSLATDFQPERYRDEHRERVLELVRRKAEGEPLALPPPPERPEVADLFDALKRSLEGARRRPSERAERPERRAPRAAARAKATPRRATGRRRSAA